MAKSFVRFLSYLALSSSVTSAIGTSPSPLSLDFHVRRYQPSTSSIEERNVDPLEVLNRETGYFADVTIGDPPQQFTLHIDTGSSDTWVPSVNSTVCREKQAACQITGQYDITMSTTSKRLARNFAIEYGDKSGHKGIMAEDTMNIGGTTIDKQTFGVSEIDLKLRPGSDDTVATGILGLSYDLGEAGAHFRNETPYPTVLQNLLDAGHIETLAYSIWLNNEESTTPDADSGSILFGAVDSAKYIAPLKTVPIVHSPDESDVVRTAVQMTSLTLTDNSGESPLVPNDTVAFAVLDTGATNSYLPLPIAKSIWSSAGVVFNSAESPYPMVACNLSTANANYTFGFGGLDGPKISVGVKEFVYGWLNNITFADGTPACGFGVFQAENNAAILGDTFLRSAYAVFDLEEDRIALAQANPSASVTDSDIQQITKGEDGIPGVERKFAASPWPAAYSATLNAFAAARTSAGLAEAAVASATQAAAPQATENVALSELPPMASFTAEASVGPTPSAGPQPEGVSKGATDLRVGSGVVGLAVLMMGAAMAVVA
ncbi:MAG: hypothetical protein Q9219_005787 [cf. Caloplaca sp. 3 TL-2023]